MMKTIRVDGGEWEMKKKYKRIKKKMKDKRKKKRRIKEWEEEEEEEQQEKDYQPFSMRSLQYSTKTLRQQL